VNQSVGCRDMELLCRHRAVFDARHRSKWLGEAERWRELAQRETASRFRGQHPGPMAMGPNTLQDNLHAAQHASQREGKQSPLD
jgi:hypothetical protein